MNYQEILSFLKERDLTMVRYDREAYDVFLKKTSFSPKFPFVHIAGSNGKSSVAHYLSSIYIKAGYKVGSFIKPMFLSPLQMIHLNGTPISEETFVALFSEFEKLFKEIPLSTFEMETILAYRFFEEAGVDVAIVECGMGGLLDSTNIPSMRPLLSIITTVSLEHTAFLGRSVSEIASQKAGIIKRDGEVLIGKLEEDAKQVISERARKENASLHEVLDYHAPSFQSPYLHFDYAPYHDLTLFSNAFYEFKDAALAVEATKILKTRLPVSEDAVRRGLLEKPLPCRLERIGNVFLDGAHNPEAILALAESLRFLGDPRPINVLFAAFKDKNIAAELPILDNLCQDITLTTFDHPRARDEMDYFLYMGDHPYNANWKLALDGLLANYPEDRILVTGSLEFAYEARAYLADLLKR